MQQYDGFYLFFVQVNFIGLLLLYNEYKLYYLQIKIINVNLVQINGCIVNCVKILTWCILK